MEDFQKMKMMDPIEKILKLIEYLMQGPKKEDLEQGKKNGIFY